MARRDKAHGVPGHAVGDARHHVPHGNQPRQPFLYGLPRRLVHLPVARDGFLFASEKYYFVVVSMSRDNLN